MTVTLVLSPSCDISERLKEAIGVAVVLVGCYIQFERSGHRGLRSQRWGGTLHSQSILQWTNAVSASTANRWRCSVFHSCLALNWRWNFPVLPKPGGPWRDADHPKRKMSTAVSEHAQKLLLTAPSR